MQLTFKNRRHFRDGFQFEDDLAIDYEVRAEITNGFAIICDPKHFLPFIREAVLSEFQFQCPLIYCFRKARAESLMYDQGTTDDLEGQLAIQNLPIIHSCPL